jgi:hypothetical protein
VNLATRAKKEQYRKRQPGISIRASGYWQPLPTEEGMMLELEENPLGELSDRLSMLTGSGIIRTVYDPAWGSLHVTQTLLDKSRLTLT